MDAESKARKPRAPRVQLACLPCRDGKLKCNRAFPTCDQCFKRSREAECRYTERGLRYNAARQRAEGIREKVERLEGFVERMRAEGKVGAGHDGEVQGKDEGAMLEPLMGNLRVEVRGGTKYVGPSHWESVIEDIADVKAYFDLESDEPDAPTGSEDNSPFSRSNLPKADIIQGVSSLFTQQELLTFVPPKPEVDRLVATWFNASEPLKLILHAPTFQHQYRAFWTDPTTTSPAWLALLLSICGLGAEISGQARRDPSTLHRAEDYRRLTAHALLLADYESAPQPHVIETLLLQVKSHLLKNHDTVPSTWHLHGQALRMMFLAGYHRDPAANPAISPFECEMRRRVWMFAVEYDVMMSYQLGMVSLLHRGVCDTRLPANLRDVDFGPEGVGVARGKEEWTPILMELWHVRLVEVYGEIVRMSHSVVGAAKADLQELHGKLDGVRDALPNVLKEKPVSESFVDPPDLILDRFRLESLYLKGLCVLYRPFISGADPAGYKTRCLDASLRLIECQIPVLEIAQPGGQLAPSAVFLARHVHDFNFAAMLLCYELKRSSADEVAAKVADRGFQTDKVRATILQACALYNVLGVTSSKARNALRAMERFLQQDADNGLQAQTGSSGDAEASSDSNWVFRNAVAAGAFAMPADIDFDYLAPFAADTNGGLFDGSNANGADQLFQDAMGAGYQMAPLPVLPTFKDPMT